MRISAILILVAACCQFAFASTRWPNEPAGSRVLLDCPFSNSICGMWDQYKSAKFASPGGTGSQLSGPFALDNSLDVGASHGGGQIGIALPNVNEIFVGTVWSTNADYQGICNNNNKLFFLRNPNLGNSLFLWKMGPSHGPSGPVGWYWQSSYNISGLMWPNVHATQISAGSGWHKIELYMKSSTTLTSKDGIIRWWVDGVLNGNFVGINFESGLSDFQYNHTWDGSGCLTGRDMSKAWHHYWDDLHISIPNCGAGGCPTKINANESKTDASQNGLSASLARATPGSLIFSFPQAANGSCKVRIFDLTGKNVYERKAGITEQKEIHIDTALKDGIYFARLAQGQKVSTVRFNVMN